MLRTIKNSLQKPSVHFDEIIGDLLRLLQIIDKYDGCMGKFTINPVFFIRFCIDCRVY